MERINPKDTAKKIQKYVEVAEALKSGTENYFVITKLTSIKSLCKDPSDAAQFVSYLAERTLEKVESKLCPAYTAPEDWERYKRLIAEGVHAIREHLERPTDMTIATLRKLLPKLVAVQSPPERHAWGAMVRSIQSGDVLIVEDALYCILQPHAASDYAYKTARDYTERYNSRYGTGLVAKSVPMLEDIIRFWSDHRGFQHPRPTLSELDVAERSDKLPQARTSKSRMESGKGSRKPQFMTGAFEQRYPAVTGWLKDGWIEIGYGEGSDSFIKALDGGGMVWEGKKTYTSVDDALNDAEKGIQAWLGKNV